MITSRITIIIPVFNEKASLCSLIHGIKKLDLFDQVILVDDGSADDCRPMASEHDILVVRHPYNKGNGAAVKSGIRAANGEMLVFMDGDGQHDPSDVPKLLSYLDHYDMVVGARDKIQQASRARALMNHIYNRLASYVTGFPVQDLTSGFRVMRAQTARELLPLLPNGYSWPTTSTLVLLRTGLSVKFVPINLRQREHGRSRIRPLYDGLRFFMIILKICTLYSPFRVFLPVSAGMFFIGLINYAYTFFTEGRFTNMSALMFTASVLVFMMGLISEQISQISLLKCQIDPSEKQKKQDTMKDYHDAADRF